MISEYFLMCPMAQHGHLFFLSYNIVSTCTTCLSFHCVSLPETTTSTAPTPILSILTGGENY